MFNRWIPGITTIEQGELQFRQDQGMGEAAGHIVAESLLTAGQYVRYGLFEGALGDFFTLQKLEPPKQQNRQVTTVDNLTLELTPRVQLSDLITQHLANRGSAKLSGE